MLLAVACILWVFAATGTAMLPMRYQILPGLALLITAPILIVLIGVDYSPWAAGLAAAAFLSMFRRPLTYLTRRALGLPAKRPSREER
jgi:hypothetical protein